MERPGLESLLGVELDTDAPPRVPRLIPQRGRGGAWMFKIMAESSGGGERPGLEFVRE